MIKRNKLVESFPYHTVVVISPHPDDSCIAVGGLLHRLKRELPGRCRTHVLVMTSGYRGVSNQFLQKHAEDACSASLWSAEDRARIVQLLGSGVEPISSEETDFLRKCRADIRRAEVQVEAQILGFKPHFLDLGIYEEHTIMESDELKLSQKLAELRTEGPHRLIVLPGRFEQHQTHRLADDLVRKVLKNRHVGEYEMWTYESPWSTMMPRPDVIVPLTAEDLHAKVEATRSHRSQLARTPYAAIVEATAVRTAAVLSEWLGAFDIKRALDLGNYAETYERLTDNVVYE